MLSDNKEVLFEYWEVEMTSKLHINADHFDGELAKMAYVFSRTEGDARKHLFTRYGPRADDPFITS